MGSVQIPRGLDDTNFPDIWEWIYVAALLRAS